jgi:hypothetical protein
MISHWNQPKIGSFIWKDWQNRDLYGAEIATRRPKATQTIVAMANLIVVTVSDSRSNIADAAIVKNGWSNCS